MESLHGSHGYRFATPWVASPAPPYPASPCSHVPSTPWLNTEELCAELAVSRSTTRYFQRPVALTQRAVGVGRWSTKTDLSAELNLKPIQARYLATSIRGGVREQKPSERKIADRYDRLLALKRRCPRGLQSE